MKSTTFFPAILILIGILLSACAATPAAPSAAPAGGEGSGEPLVTEIAFTGVIEGIDNGQWVVSGQTVKVDPAAVQGGPFVAGDTVKVEARVEADGSLTAQRVESPSAADLASTSTAVPSASSPDFPLTFDDSGTEAFGTVDVMTDTSITVAGQTFSFAPGAEIKGIITAGTFVKLHFIVNADGSLSVREVEISDPALVGADNSNDDNSNANTNDDNGNDDNSNDDNGNDDGSNDDNGNDDDSNDDNGGNSNDDDSDDDNSDDDNDNG
jgi:hypothetical protein